MILLFLRVKCTGSISSVTSYHAYHEQPFRNIFLSFPTSLCLCCSLSFLPIVLRDDSLARRSTSALPLPSAPLPPVPSVPLASPLPLFRLLSCRSLPFVRCSAALRAAQRGRPGRAPSWATSCSLSAPASGAPPGHAHFAGRTKISRSRVRDRACSANC